MEYIDLLSPVESEHIECDPFNGLISFIILEGRLFAQQIVVLCDVDVVSICKANPGPQHNLEHCFVRVKVLSRRKK